MWTLPVSLFSAILARRRLHDLNWTGWLAWLTILPFLNLLLGLALVFKRGDDDYNQYGPKPCANPSGMAFCTFSVWALVAVGAAIGGGNYHPPI